MSIWIDSLSPSKNATDISVASEVNIVLKSDDADLDIQSIQFCINDTEVEPSSRYSIQTGSTEDRQTVFVDFFPRRRIKYANERYGADDTRYGKLDIFPSNFLYGLTYTCKVRISDFDGNTFEDFFTFTIEDGVFHNETPANTFYYTTTQEMANYLPEWTRARYDQFSNFQQFTNPSANFLKQIDDKINNDFANSYVQTANYNEFALAYKAEIGSDFEFNTIVLDGGETLQIPPEVKARTGISVLYPSAEFSNSIKDFYYEKIPSRLEEDKTRINDNIILPKMAAQNRRFEINFDLERQGGFLFKIEDGLQFTERNAITDELDVFLIRISGVSSQDQEQEEDISAIDNDNYYTKKRWSRINYIRFLNVPENSNINWTLQYLKDPDSYIADTFKEVNQQDEIQTSFWKLGSSIYGSTLGQYTFLDSDLDGVISTLGEKRLVKEYELLDVDKITNLNLKDIAVDPFSDWIYGINDEHLFIFDKKEEYTKVIDQLPSNNVNPGLVVDVNTESDTRDIGGKIVEIAGIQTDMSKNVVKYRFSMRNPGGAVSYILQNGSTTSNAASAMTQAERDVLHFTTKSVELALQDLGDYVVTLEAGYDDGSTSIDSKIVRVRGKSALVKYKLERLLFESTVENFDRDFDGRIKIYDSGGFLHSLRQVRDNMLVDYTDGILYFNENYDEVTVNE